MAVRLLVFLHTDGDLDVAEPILRRAPGAGFRISACMTTKFRAQTPDARARLKALDCSVTILSPFKLKWLRSPSFWNVDVFLTATESTLAVHRIAHAVTRRANARGVRTYTMQQGLENVGLTYFDERHDSSVDFAAQQILIWGPVANLPSDVPKATRDRCVAVGSSRLFSARVGTSARADGGRLRVGVFENLHWHRYPDAYRRSFFESLRAVAASTPDADFILKPHPKSKWSADDIAANMPSNVTVSTGASRETGSSLARSSDRVITTPSTIALDAAGAGTPVAVVGGQGLDVSYYSPLDILETTSDWKGFLSAGQEDSARKSFISRVLIEGDAVGRILDVLRG